jgi:magnesium-transporting ATPase (P-type)
MDKSISGADTLLTFGTNHNTGLASAEAAERLFREGANEVPEKKSHPFFRLARKFCGLSAWMLELIVGLSLVLGKIADFWITLALLLVNALLSFLQEQRASSTVAALRHRLQISARVLRDGCWQAILARELMRGDVIRLRPGDFVPADAQIFDGVLAIDQSALTGESRPLNRVANEVIYSGSIVRQGEATAIVVATGVRTYFRRTTELVESARPKLHVEAVVAKVVKGSFSLSASWCRSLWLFRSPRDWRSSTSFLWRSSC